MKFIKDLIFTGIGYMLGKRRRARAFGDVFRRKYVITIHPWGVPILALAVALPLVFKFSYIYNAIEVAIVATSIVLVWRMARIVNHMKYEMWHILHGMSDADEEDRYQAWMDKQGAPDDNVETLPSKRINGQRSSRVSK